VYGKYEEKCGGKKSRECDAEYEQIIIVIGLDINDDHVIGQVLTLIFFPPSRLESINKFLREKWSK